MRKSLAMLLGLVVLAAVAAPAHGQTWKLDVGVNGGGSWWTALVDEDQTGGGSAAFETSWLVGAQATGWLKPRLGIRLNFPFEDRALEAREGTLFTGVDPRSLDHINIWGPSLDLLFRLKTPATDFQRGEWLPYVALGVGARYVNPAGDRFRAVDEANDEYWDGVPFGTAQDTLFLSELSTVMGLAALGTDVRLSPLFALRLEVGDRISKPYAYAVTRRSESTFIALDGHENDASLSHELYGTVGLHLTFGGSRSAAAVVTQAPPPPPPPAPPAPPAPPREESMSVCVIDATSAGGVRTVAATYLPSSGDTLVAVNGQRVAFRTTVAEVPVVATAEWLVAGRPVVVETKPVVRFLAIGQPRTVADGTLVLLGTVNGQHVFAERAALGAAAERFGTGAELATTLQNAELRRAFDAVQTLYMPYRTVGCSFQPLQRQEEVRKAS